MELAGIVSSPAGQAFDRRERLNRVPGWLCLTGTLTQLQQQVWHEYGTASQDEIYMIDQAGHVRQEYNTGTGRGTAALNSSAVLFVDAARQAQEGN